MNGYTTQLNYQPEILAKINFLIAEVKKMREELEALKLAVVFPAIPPPPPYQPLTRHESYAICESPMCPSNQHGC
jgi:hypothetical protein